MTAAYKYERSPMKNGKVLWAKSCFRDSVKLDSDGEENLGWRY